MWYLTIKFNLNERYNFFDYFMNCQGCCWCCFAVAAAVVTIVTVDAIVAVAIDFTVTVVALGVADSAF